MLDSSGDGGSHINVCTHVVKHKVLDFYVLTVRFE